MCVGVGCGCACVGVGKGVRVIQSFILQSAFQVCERMFSALLAWATTRDVRYLLAAQRSLTAVQNQEGDT